MRLDAEASQGQKISHLNQVLEEARTSQMQAQQHYKSKLT